MQRQRGKTRSPSGNDNRARNSGFFFAVAATHKLAQSYALPSFVTLLWASKEGKTEVLSLS